MSFDPPFVKCGLRVLLCCIFLAACSAEESMEKPPPAQLTRDDTGYFCGMIVEDHQGPKSHVILEGSGQTLWFTSARDGIAFMLLPEETRPVSAFYVSAVDQGGWEHPEANSSTWVEAEFAWFVIDSEKLGSMGAPESIPFIAKEAAQAFAAQFGGRVLSLAEIPDSYILGHGQTTAENHAGDL
jgi:copper chaperone NosL